MAIYIGEDMSRLYIQLDAGDTRLLDSDDPSRTQYRITGDLAREIYELVMNRVESKPHAVENPSD